MAERPPEKRKVTGSTPVPTTIEDHVQNVYSSAAVVAEYTVADELQPPEQVILNLLRPELASVAMLDIGVGGGRTTSYFGPVSGSYVGVDYSSEMVAACRRRFAGREDYRFETADVRDLSRFGDGTFGLVLFSFNGLDDVPAGDRGQALAEIRRVARPGGWFCFSSHNLQALDQRHLGVRRQLSRDPRRLARNLRKWLRLRLIHNRHLYGRRLATLQATTVVDYNHGQFMRTYYSRPAEQVSQLTQAGFGEPRVFGLDGSELQVPRDFGITDHWLYYLCEVR